jgi:hypothetical protein
LRNDKAGGEDTFDLERPLPQTCSFVCTNDWIQTDHMRGFIYVSFSTLLIL